MTETRWLMGMPITVHVVDKNVRQAILDEVYAYFATIDDRFSTYKETSEISAINKHSVKADQYSDEMKEVFWLAEKTKQESLGYFDIVRHGHIDPSGIVKGYAILNASQKLLRAGFQNFFIDAGGDIQVHGKNDEGQPWTVGIRNPFQANEIVKVIQVNDQGVATSGTASRGQHIYNPHKADQAITDIVSITVIGPNIVEADRFATAAFAMGLQGIQFIEARNGLEGYMIDRQGIATMTHGFSQYLYD